MALLERVSTLVRANLNDLIDKAEHPEKMIKQVILDMQNQLLQVKTQVAIAIADQHVLEKKQKENEEKVSEWMRKAELAVGKNEDDLARAALQRVESYRDLVTGFGQQATDQKAQADNLKIALRPLETKLAEAQGSAGEDTCTYATQCLSVAACAVGVSSGPSPCRTSAPRTQKITSSAMLVAWSATRSRFRAISKASSACRVTAGFSFIAFTK